MSSATLLPVGWVRAKGKFGLSTAGLLERAGRSTSLNCAGKEFNELNMGGGRRNKGMKQFLENDRKVLGGDWSEFECFIDNIPRFDRNRYVG